MIGKLKLKRLNKIARILTGVLGLAILAPLQAEEWTLARVVESARQASPDADIFRSRIDAAQALAKQADATLLPHLKVEAGYHQTNQPLMGFGGILNTGTFDQTIDFNRPGQLDQFNATATVAYNIYSGGSASARRSAASANHRAITHDQEAALEDLSLAVVHAFYRVLQAREFQLAISSALTAIEKSIHAAEARLTQGDLLRSTLLDLEVRKAEIESELLGARHQLELSKRMLRVTLGFSPDHPMIPALDVIKLTPPGDKQEMRAELQAMTERISAADAAVDAQRGQRRPRVDAFAAYQYDRGWRRSGNGDSWIAGLRMQWDIFDGNLSDNRIRQSIAERAELRAMERKLQLHLQMESEEALLKYQLASSQLSAAERAVEHAEESALISRARFASGDLLVTELLNVESRLTHAQVRQAVARFNQQIAIAEWYRSAGIALSSSTFAIRQYE